MPQLLYYNKTMDDGWYSTSVYFQIAGSLRLTECLWQPQLEFQRIIALRIELGKKLKSNAKYDIEK